MSADSIFNLVAIKAIARTPSEMIEAHGALLDVQFAALDAAQNEALPIRERRAAYWRWAAVMFMLEMTPVITMDQLGIPEDNEPLTAEERGGLWDMCVTYERQIRTGDQEARARSYAHLTQIYEGFGLTGPTLETILTSDPKVPDAACAPLKGGAV